MMSIAMGVADLGGEVLTGGAQPAVLAIPEGSCLKQSHASARQVVSM